MNFPDLTRLHVTVHAEERAEERLGIGRVGFHQWCAATAKDWVPQLPDFFHQQGLDVTRVVTDAVMYQAAWTLDRDLCLVVTQSAALKTVMDYRPKTYRRTDLPPAAGPQVLCPLDQWPDQTPAIKRTVKWFSARRGPMPKVPTTMDTKTLALLCSSCMQAGQPRILQELQEFYRL